MAKLRDLFRPQRKAPFEMYRPCMYPECIEVASNKLTFTTGVDADLYITFPQDGAEHIKHKGQPICEPHTKEVIENFERYGILSGGAGESTLTRDGHTTTTVWIDGASQKL